MGANTLTFNLLDASGFTIAGFDTPFRSIIRAVDSEGKPMNWNVEGQQPMPRKTFDRIQNLTYSWQYSEDLRTVLEK
jgi:hypothetical protein